MLNSWVCCHGFESTRDTFYEIPFEHLLWSFSPDRVLCRALVTHWRKIKTIYQYMCKYLAWKTGKNANSWMFNTLRQRIIRIWLFQSNFLCFTCFVQIYVSHLFVKFGILTFLIVKYENISTDISTLVGQFW